MKTNMANYLRAALVAPIAACALAIGTPSFAQAAGPNNSPAQVMSSNDAHPGGDDVRERKTEARIKHLHDLLKITSEQEGQWSSVAQVMQDNASAVDDAFKDRTQKASSMNAVDDLLSYQAIVAAHADGLKKFADAFTPLYSAMPAPQQKNADAVFSHRIEEAKSKAHG
jgi:periplasmic protein CpxP/Spy